MTVLLLGGTGLLGHTVLKQLLQQGHEVHALLRSLPQLEILKAHYRDASAVLPSEGCHDSDGVCPISILNSQFTIYYGSLLDDNKLQAAAEGCDAIINCAGVTDMSLLHYDDYLPVNRDLCSRLINVMERLNITRLVHTSTANTIGYGSP